MQVDEQQIIDDTRAAYFSTDVQRNKYNSLTTFVKEQDYVDLHSSPLVPLDIKVDVEQFVQEIQQYDQHFEQWGNQHLHLPRYGLALVNLDGHLKKKDPINGSLYQWNLHNPNNPILETDCVTSTEVMNLPSLNPLNVFNGHWCRSNILKWNNGAHFLPHIDTFMPAPWIRLWGTTSNDVKIRFAKNGVMTEYGDVEPGRLYIIDTLKVHDARCEGSTAYQFFLSVVPSALDLLQQYKSI
jgi:hypothetical protein